MRIATAIAVMTLTALFSAPAFSQGRGGAGGAAGNAGAGTAPGASGRSTTSPSPNFPDDVFGQPKRPIFLSGRVMLNDGTPPPEPVKIERVCGMSVRTETYTDRKGRFNFQVGQTFELQDASESTIDPLRGAGGGLRNGPGGDPAGGGVSERSLWGCDLRASLPGFRSDSISLANTHYMDSPEVGTIVLHRLGNVEGLTVSATSALAPKDARKAFEKGFDAAGKHKPDEAQKNFEKAVALYPRFAAAWMELGKLNEQRSQFDDARKDYQQSLEADSKFIPPYERLSWLALKDAKWQELADTTDKMLRLDPFSYPDAYYLSSVANYQLRNFDVAEKNAREAIRLDPAKKNTRSYYVLGLTLAMKHDFAHSAESIRTFIDSQPKGADLESVRQQLKQIEQEASQAGPAQPAAEAAPSAQAKQEP